MSCVMIYDVLCRDMTMYCFEDWIVVDHVKICIVFVVCLYIFVTYFGDSSSGKTAKTRFI
jgi:hypothetical protein